MKKTRLFLLFTIIAFCITTIFGITYGWVADNGMYSQIGITSHIHKSYFESGDGTKDNPFEIKYPVQFYYLSWLQYLGYFNNDINNNGKIDSSSNASDNEQYYFYLSDNLDMTDFCLPPIGTKQYPFIGNFDGKSYTISNLTVANNKDDLTDYDDKYDNQYTEIIGMFGVVGTLKNNTYSYTYDSSINCIKNFYISSANIETSTDNALVGIACGYVNGKVEDVGIVSSSINVKKNTNALNDITSNLSDYALVGFCEDDYKDKVDVVEVDIADVNYDANYNPGSGSGDGNNWGSSINIYNLSKRITYIMNDSMSFSSYSSIASPNKFGLQSISYNKYNSKTEAFYQLSGLQAYLYNGSNFPLNVDVNSEFAGGEITNTKTDSSSKYRNWKTATTAFFSNESNTSEILNDNQGYITSPATTTKYDGTLHYIRSMSTVLNSFGGTTYDANKLVMLTYKDGEFVRIVDGDNTSNNTNLNSLFSGTIDKSSLNRYDDVKSYFTNLYGDGSNKLIYTLGWTNTTSSVLNGNFTMNNTSYTSLLSPGIDFVVKSSGYITIVLCSQSNDVGNKLISLYKVSRDSSGTPSKGEEITDGIPESASSTFAKNSCILYLEIPVEAGEYFITTDSGTMSTAADFMYLDIGSNGATSESTYTKTEEVYKKVTYTYDVANGVALKNTNDGTISEIDSATFTINTSITGTNIFKIEENTASPNELINFVGKCLTNDKNTNGVNIITELTKRTTIVEKKSDGSTSTKVTEVTIITTNGVETKRTSRVNTDGVITSLSDEELSNYVIDAPTNIIANITYYDKYHDDTAKANVSFEYEYSNKINDSSKNTYNITIESNKSIEAYAQNKDSTNYGIIVNDTDVSATGADIIINESNDKN